MTPVTSLAGKTVALFGLGGSGLATALALQAGGAGVVACDDDPARMAKAAEKGIETGDLRTADWSRFSSLILSPGVPLTHPEPHWSAKLAYEAGVEVIGDIELFCRERQKIAPDAPFIAITGTNGKSTTTALIAHILREAGRDVQMGGNIGTAILSLEPPAKDRVHVVEISSFQIDLTPSFLFDPGPDSWEDSAPNGPSVGVLLNISPDHLDRHGSMEAYAAIKARVFTAARRGISNCGDPLCLEIMREAEKFSYCFEALDSDPMQIGEFCPPDFFVYQDKVYSCDSVLVPTLVKEGASFESIFELHGDLSGTRSLRGRHNAENVAAAVAAVTATWLDVSPEQTARAILTFPGLPHRMEEVGRRGRVIFVNDSKATNADSTDKALAAFDRIFWILGGKAKEGGITPLTPYFPKIEKAYLIGAATEDFAATLDGKVPFVRCGTLDRAVAQAAEDAARSDRPEPVVLLSPACASYDQYPNFEVRGDHFRTLVRALPGVEVKQS